MTASEAPVSPATVSSLMQSLADPRASLAHTAEVVASDHGLAARVLAVANSAAYGFARRITDIPQAVGLLGTNMVQTLAIAGACHLLDGSSALPRTRAHAMEVATAARYLAERVGLPTSDAFAAGLLHDVGEILLWQRDPGGYVEAYATWGDAEEQLRGERGAYGTDHARVAREQLAEWQLPGGVVDAVGDHHRPDLCHRDLSTVVVAAEELADPRLRWSPRFMLFGIEPGDVQVARLDLAQRVAELQALLAR